MLSCQEMIDEIQARVGRTGNDDLMDDTWVTRRINEAQKVIVEAVPMIPSLTFKNTTSIDTTGTIRYAVSDITVGDTTDRQPCNITNVWYLDGNDSRQLLFVLSDEFDMMHPDPTHSDEHVDRPAQWTQRDNQYIEMWPYCASAYWDKNLRFDGDYYPVDFTTDSTSTGDISRADEGLMLYSVWQAWKIIGDQAQMTIARKAWSNPEPSYGEDAGWLEKFRDNVNSMIQWSGNYYDNAI